MIYLVNEDTLEAPTLKAVLEGPDGLDLVAMSQEFRLEESPETADAGSFVRWLIDKRGIRRVPHCEYTFPEGPL